VFAEASLLRGAEGGKRSSAMSAALTAAGWYLAAGLAPIPVNREKRPMVEWRDFQTRRPTEDEIREWFTRWPLAGVALVCGAVSRLAVIDVDPRNGAGGEALAVRLPGTVTVLSGGGGRHLYFALRPGERVSKVGSLMAGVDLQAEGACVTAPPSLHRNGRRYRFAPGLGLGEVPLAPLPAVVRGLVSRRNLERSAPLRRQTREAASGLTAEAVLGRLHRVRRIAAGWSACCPAHEDHKPSLSVGEGDGGRVLLYCHRGCSFGSILHALGFGGTA
jgi:bifunctional DNA primase/polymerase-like protein